MLLSFAIALALTAEALPTVAAQHQDIQRSGVNQEETVLDHEHVIHGFGKIFELPVDGEIYAQPLYIPQVTVNGETHDILLVASMRNGLYAFAAERPLGPGERALWFRQLGEATEGLRPFYQIQHQVPPGARAGIMSTPIVDVENRMVYAVSTTYARDQQIYTLWKLNLETGETVSSREIFGALPGHGVDAQILEGVSQVVFNGALHFQRPGLLLYDGFVHLAFGGVGDTPPYHGWLFSYRADNLEGGPSFLATPEPLREDGPGAGIWQSGQGLTVDETGAMYLATGNGDFSAEHQDWGNTILKLRFDGATRRFRVDDYFTPFNQHELAALDLDIGSAGILFVPPHFVIGAGKTGKFYVLDRDHLGGYTPRANGDSGAIQVFNVTEPSWRKIVNNTFLWNIHGAPVQWRGQVYVMGESDPVKAFRMDLVSGRLDEEPTSRSLFKAPLGMPGGFLTLSLNRARENESAILWVSHPYEGDATFNLCPGVLHALDAHDLSRELWSSQTLVEDRPGNFAKFVVPTIAAGRVYLATFSDKVVVYGRRD